MDGAREVARLVAFVEEVLDGRPTVQATTIGVKTRVVDQVVALVEQIVCAEHVQREEVRVDGVESNEVASVGVQVQGQTQVPIELKLVVTDQPVVGHIISGPVVGHRGIVQIQLLDVGVDREPSERPQAHRRNREEGVAPLLILETHLDGMVPDVTRTRHAHPELGVAADLVAVALGSVVAPQAIGGRRYLTIQKSIAVLHLQQALIGTVVPRIVGLVIKQLEVLVVDSGQLRIVRRADERHQRVLPTVVDETARGGVVLVGVPVVYIKCTHMTVTEEAVFV